MSSGTHEFESFIIFNFISLHYSLTHPYWSNQENRDRSYSYSLLYLNGWALTATALFSQFKIFLFLFSVWHLHTWPSPTYSSVGDRFALSWMLLQKKWMQGLFFFFFNYVNFMVIWILSFTCLVSIYENLEKYTTFAILFYVTLSTHWWPPLSWIKVSIGWWLFAWCIFKR